MEAFYGKWQEESKEGFEAIAKAIGLPDDKAAFYQTATPEITYQQEGDTWVIDVGMAGIPNGRQFRFKLGEPYESASLDGSPLHSVITAEGGKFTEKHTGETLQGAEMGIIRWIENGKMMVETNIAGIQMKSVYKQV